MKITTRAYQTDYQTLSQHCDEYFEKIGSSTTLDDIPEYKSWLYDEFFGAKVGKTRNAIRFKIIQNRKGTFLSFKISIIKFLVVAVLLNGFVAFISYMNTQSVFHLIYSITATLVLFYIYRSRLYSSALDFTMKLEKKIRELND